MAKRHYTTVCFNGKVKTKMYYLSQDLEDKFNVSVTPFSGFVGGGYKLRSINSISFFTMSKNKRTKILKWLENHFSKSVYSRNFTIVED